MKENPRENQNSGEDDEQNLAEKLYEKWGSLRTVRLSFFQRIHQSMRGFNFYRLVLLESGKRAFYYLLKLSLLVGVITGLFFGYTNYVTAGKIADELRAQMPRTTITDGKVSVDAETPYRINLREDFEVILDPEAELNRLRLESNVIAVLVQSSLYVRSGRDSFESWPLSTFIGETDGKTITITPDKIREWTPFISYSLFVMSVVIMILFVIMQSGFFVLIISAGGLFASESQSPVFSWTTFLALSCYAVTPVVLTQAFLFITGMSLPFQQYLLLGAGALYMYFIVKYLEQNLMDVNYESSEGSTFS